MSNGTRNRINAAFDDELSAAPVPAGLRVLSIRDAVAVPRRRPVQPQLLVVVATIVVIALVASFVIGSHVLRSSTPAPAKPKVGSLTPPPPRSEASFAYDGAHDQLVLFGGSPIAGDTTNETWTWDGKYWTLHHTSPLPGARTQALIAYDQTHQDVVMYGGTAGRSAYNDTWRWNGSSWIQLHPAHEPGLNFDWPATMDFDPVSRAVVLYGFQNLPAANGTSMQAKTWSWDGSDWKQLSPPTSPTTTGLLVGGGARLYLIAASAGRVGGRYVSQMWFWDGSNWNLLPATDDLVEPPAAAAYDQARGKLIAQNLDTWSWDPHGWTRIQTANRPRAAGYMQFFPPLHEVISYGSLYGDTNNDVWAWNGADWGLLEPGNVANPAANGQLGPTTPDAARAFIKQTMTATTPALFPAWLPAGMEATSVVATADQFDVELASDQRDKTISLNTDIGNPPPGTPQSSDVHVKFRNALAMKYQAAGTAEYFVYDPSAPRSDRWLIWIEPGTTSIQGSTSPGVSYFLFASGLTDQEFWQVANSLG